MFQTPCGDSPLIIKFGMPILEMRKGFVSNPLRGFTSNHLRAKGGSRCSAHPWFQTPCGDSPLIILSVRGIANLSNQSVSNPLRGFTSNHLFGADLLKPLHLYVSNPLRGFTSNHLILACPESEESNSVSNPLRGFTSNHLNVLKRRDSEQREVSNPLRGFTSNHPGLGSMPPKVTSSFQTPCGDSPLIILVRFQAER